MWKLGVLCELLLFVTAILPRRADTPDQQLLTAVSDRVNIRSTGAHPFQMDADFTAQINVPQKGHLTWKWVSSDLWSQEVEMGAYRQLNIRKGDTLYISRNTAFTPIRIRQLEDLLTVFSAGSDSWQVEEAET
jgi:hypothetical protein